MNKADNHRSEEQFGNPEEFEKLWKKLEKSAWQSDERCDKVNKLSQDRQPW